MFFTTFSRLIRHMLVPLVMLMIERGWLPAAAQEDAIELLLIIVTSFLVLLWSYLRELKVEDKKLKDILNGPD